MEARAVCKQALTLLLTSVLAHPAWGNPNVVGNISTSKATAVRGTSVTPGSTIFSGDTIEVGPQGSAWIILTGGAQVQVDENSQVRLTKLTDRIQLTIDRGTASFRTVEQSPVEALLGDATIRSANSWPAVGIVSVRNAQSAMIAAQKGALLITTAHDSGSVTLREGETGEVTLIPETDEERKKKGGVIPAGSLTAGMTAKVTVILVALTTTIGFIRGHYDPSHTVTQNCNAVSPFRCP
jgi:hypothetical protein